MHCLYCDRPLALLKRLTGDGEFCSKEHRRIYQQEHNQLALARLLESQPKGKEKLRPDKAQSVKPEAEIMEPIQPVKAPQAPDPPRAGFLSESLAAGPVPSTTRLASVPRVKPGSAVWGGIEAASSFQGSRPKTAGFLAESLRPSLIAGAVQLQSKSKFKPPVANLRIEERPLSSKGGALKRPQPSGAGFVFEPQAGRLSVGNARPPAEARFSPLRPVTARAGLFPRGGGDCNLRMAKFISGSVIEPTRPGSVRLPAIGTRWKQLSPVLPKKAPGKIILVLGSFLQRPVRPAGQDLLPEAFEIPFQPISYPQYSPRMGCLEERLHRTDRIGFSPP